MRENLADVPIFLSSGLSQALILVHTNPVHNVRITVTLFLTYLLRPVPVMGRCSYRRIIIKSWRFLIVEPTW